MIRRLFAVAALAVLGVAGAGASSALPLGASDGLAAAPPAADGATVSLDLSSFAPSVLLAGDQLETTATVVNPTALAMMNLTVTLSVTRDPIVSRSTLATFLDNPATLPTDAAVTAPVMASGLATNGATNTLPAGAIASVNLAASLTALGMPAGTTGVYGILVTVEGATGVLASHTAAITFYDSPLPDLHVAAVASATGSPERVEQVLAAASNPGAAIAIDPIAVRTTAQASSIAASHEVFAVPSGDVDLTSLAHAGNEALISFAVADAADNAPSPLNDLPWLATIPVPDQPTIALAATHGAAAGILDSAALGTLGTGAPVVDVAVDGGTFPVLVPEPRLSSILATYRPGEADAPARLVAEAALVAAAGDGTTPVVVAPGDAWQLPGPTAASPLSALLTAPWVRPVSVESVLEGQARGSGQATAVRGTDADMPAEQLVTLDRRLDDVRQLAQTAADPNTIYLPSGRALLQPLALPLRQDPTVRDATYVATTEEVDATLTSLAVAAGSDVNLIAASGNVPVTLHNDLNVDATVTVVMKSGSPNLVVQDQPVVTIPAGGDVTAHVAVTGVKSANVTATVALQNANGDVVASPQLLRVRVRADWGNAVTAVFTVAIVLLLIAGLIRTIRRGRRSSRMAPEPSPRAPEPAQREGEQADG